MTGDAVDVGGRLVEKAASWRCLRFRISGGVRKAGSRDLLARVPDVDVVATASDATGVPPLALAIDGASLNSISS